MYISTAGCGLLCVSLRSLYLFKDGGRERGGTETAQPRFLGHLGAASRANHVVYLAVEARDRTCRREREEGCRLRAACKGGTMAAM